MKTRFVLGALAGIVACAIASPSARASDPVYYDNVVIVLDASGSMKGVMRSGSMTKINAAKSALKAVVKTLPKDTRVGLLVFSAKNLPSDWAYPLGPRNEEQLMQAIDAPQPNSGTPLGRYIKIGADRLLEERAKQFGYGTYRLLVVTDGEAQDQDLVNRYTPQAIARGITVDVIGVDMRQSHTLATKVHSYRRADDPASLQRAVAEVFAEVSSTGRDSTVTEGFELLKAIPVETALGMLQALATSGNHPLGENPQTSAAENHTTAKAAAVPNTPAPQPPPSRATPVSPPPRAPAPPRSFFAQPLFIFFAALVFIAFVVLKSRGR